MAFPGCRGTSSKSFSDSLISVSVRILLYSYFDISATFKEKMMLRRRTQILEFSDRLVLKVAMYYECAQHAQILKLNCIDDKKAYSSNTRHDTIFKTKILKIVNANLM